MLLVETERRLFNFHLKELDDNYWMDEYVLLIENDEDIEKLKEKAQNYDLQPVSKDFYLDNFNIYKVVKDCTIEEFKKAFKEYYQNDYNFCSLTDNDELSEFLNFDGCIDYSNEIYKKLKK